jgi:positive regulator of sigma E activity
MAALCHFNIRYSDLAGRVMRASHIHQYAKVSARTGCTLELKPARSGGCGQCSAKSGCGLFVLPRKRSLHFELPTDASIEPGQTLRFELPVAGLGRMALVHYLTIPVAAFSGALLVSALLDRWTDLVALFGAVTGFLVGCAALKLYDSRAGQYWLERVDVRHSSEELPSDT